MITIELQEVDFIEPRGDAKDIKRSPSEAPADKEYLEFLKRLEVKSHEGFAKDPFFSEIAPKITDNDLKKNHA